MKYELTGKPDFAMATLSLAAGEKVTAEAGAMVAMSANMKIETKAKGGLLGGLKRALVGESFFTNDFTAEGDAGTISLAPSIPGDVEAVELNGGTMYMQSGAYVAHVGNINIDTKLNLQSFFAGEGLFLIKLTGTGTVFFCSYGGLKKIPVAGSYIVDTTHIVAFQDSLTFNVQAVGGLKATFLSGEGLVCRFSGQGDLWIQTRSAPPFAFWLNPFRPVEKSNN
ncbi:MAG TPA: TIGR00266 family protein [bacterium]|nr:TIGR00266 family protein [bacterium]